MRFRPLALDFSGRRQREPKWGAALLIAGALLCLLAGARAAHELGDEAAIRRRLVALDAASAGPPAKPAAKGLPDARLASRIKASAQVAQSLQSPWADLLGVLEVKPADGVALLSVEPSAVKRTVRITAEARDADAMLAHLSMLQGDPRLAEVVLLSHQQQERAPGAPWRYQLQGAW